MKYLISIALVCYVAVGMAQQNTSEKISRDLEVAAEVLSTLLERDRDRPHFGRWGQEIEARHMPGVGAVFTLPQSPFGIFAAVAPDVDFEHHNEGGSEVIVTGNAFEIRDKNGRHVGEFMEERNGEIESAVRQFFTDYGSLLRRLDRDEQVVVKTSSRNQHQEFVLAWSQRGKKEKSEQKGLEIMVKVADLLDHDEGKIDQETLEERITVNEFSMSSPGDEPELDVFSSILHRLFKSDISDTYYMDRMPYYDRTGLMGVTYHVKVYSSSSDDGLHFIPTLGKGNLTQEERNDIIEGLYDQFVDNFKENVLDYGHTLKSIDDSEPIIFNINLTECNGCDMPKEIELSVQKSVLSKYRENAISLSDAMAEFNLSIIK